VCGLLDAVGGTEWLVIGCMLIQASREKEPIQWVRDVLKGIGLGQRRQLHFRELDEWRKPLACQQLAQFPVRLFALLSNKKRICVATETPTLRQKPIHSRHTSIFTIFVCG
jgi:hypothetical protein